MDERAFDRRRNPVSEVRAQIAEESVAITGQVVGDVNLYNITSETFLPAVHSREPEPGPAPMAVYARICVALARLAHACSRASESLYRGQRTKGEAS
ncbi:hypothetical protein ACWGKU_24270 [Kitasatospora sp. NPDC054768]